MQLSENIMSAFRNVFSNKMRTFLTMLGIIIGIAAVIAITSLVMALKHRLLNSLILLV